jgi:uncharacterized protein (DUF1015 family)
MATVRPFRALYYNTERVGNVSQVICPPYDVIGPAQRNALAHRHPNNFVQFELPDPADPAYSATAKLLHLWEKQHVLIEDNVKAFYLLQQDFEIDGQPVSRLGIFAAVKLEPFSKGVIFPHEVTFSAPKEERFKQLAALRTNTSPVFAFFPDPRAEIFRLMKKAAFGTTLIDAEDDTAGKLKIYAIRDRVIQDTLSRAFESRRLFIADGHHRYETALRYASTHGGGFDAASSYVMMYLVSVEDPGIRILPTHRLFKSWPEGMDLSIFLEQAAIFFEINELDFDQINKDRVEYHLDRPSYVPTCVFYSREKPETLFSLRIRDACVDQFAREIEDPQLAALDVNVLAKFLFNEVLHFKPEDLDQIIAYDHGINSSLEAVREGRAEGAFMVRPTSMKTVMELAQRLVKMPPKSTYFFPKPPSGLVARKI